MTVEAHILHHLPGRVRLKMPDRVGDPAYFADLEKQLGAFQDFETLSANPETGSLLMQDGRIDLDALSGYAEEKNLFTISNAPAPAKPVSDNFMAPITQASLALKKRSGGRIDLPEVAFLLMMAFGIYRLIRGKLSAPPWYTAFWYAYGISKIITKSRAETGEGSEAVPESRQS
jgi:hypothetical protein